MEVNQTLLALQELIDVVAKLRSPQGCPWDLAQTPSSLTPYVIEEAYEVVDAIQTGDKKAISEELGDLLLQVVLQAQIASEAGDFSLQEVAEGIAKKLIRRHLHVFAGPLFAAGLNDIEPLFHLPDHKMGLRLVGEDLRLAGNPPAVPDLAAHRLLRYRHRRHDRALRRARLCPL